MVKTLSILLLLFVDEIALRNSIRQSIDMQLKAAETEIEKIRQETNNLRINKGQGPGVTNVNGKTVRFFPNEKSKEEYLATFDERIIKAKHTLLIGPELTFSPVRLFRVGDVGIPNRPISIEQIIDDYILGEFNDDRYLLDGWNTTKMSTGRVLNLTRPIYASRTQTYTTVLGATKTVIVLKPVPDKIIQKVIDEFKEEFKPKTEVRTWKYEGEELKGQAVKYTAKSVTIQTDSGEKELLIKKMYAADRTHAKRELGPVLDKK